MSKLPYDASIHVHSCDKFELKPKNKVMKSKKRIQDYLASIEWNIKDILDNNSKKEILKNHHSSLIHFKTERELLKWVLYSDK